MRATADQWPAVAQDIYSWASTKSPGVIKDQPANVTEAINAARVAQSLELPASDADLVAKTVKDAIAEQLQSVKEELAALTVNEAAPSQSNFQRQQQPSPGPT